MRTGDLGFMSDGELFVTGRIKDLIIIHGVNLYPQDIEATAQRAVPKFLRINSGGAFMIGEDNDEKLVLVQEVERRFRPGDEKDIFPEIRKAIAIEHEVPIDTIVLVRTGTIPKTSSGKIQRHSCYDGFLKNELNVVARWSVADPADEPIIRAISRNRLRSVVIQRPIAADLRPEHRQTGRRREEDRRQSESRPLSGKRDGGCL